MNSKKTQQNSTGNSRKPRFIVTHEYSGTQSMQTAFVQVIESQACSQFKEWRKKEKNSG